LIKVGDIKVGVIKVGDIKVGDIKAGDIKVGNIKVTKTGFRKQSHFVTENIFTHPFGITVDDTEYVCLHGKITQIFPTAFFRRNCVKP
jgi:hypothetical protein